MPRVDILFLAFVLIGLVWGFISNWYRQLIGIIVFAAIFGVFYLFFLDYLTKFVEYDLINYMVEQGFIKPIEFYVESLDTTFKIESVLDGFLFLQNIDMDPEMLKVVCEGVCKAAVLFVGFIVIGISSILISSLLYWILLRWIMPRNARKGVVAHLFGGLLGALLNGTYVLLLLGFTGNIFGAIDDSIIAALKDSSSQLSILFTDTLAITDSATLVKFAPYVEAIGQVFDPLNANSIAVRPIYETLASMGFSPLNIVSVEVINEAGDKVSEPFRTSFSNFISSIMDEGIGKINALLGN